MTVLNRRDAYSAIPQLEKKIGSLTDYITVENGKVKISAKDLYLRGSEMTVSLEEVGMKYVDKDEIIAQINASEEGVLIAADKVNIQGAAIFSEYAKKEEASEDVQRIYYRTNTTSTPTAPTTWVTSTATANNTWTTKRMQYDRTYKYLFSCIQQQMADGEIENTAVLLDDTTTVIDGGNIITNTITLNQIAVATQNDIKNSELSDDIEDAASKATTYIRSISGKGLCICRSLTDNDNVLALTNGSVDIYAGGSHTASFISSGLEFYRNGSRCAWSEVNTYNELAFNLNGNGSCYVGAYASSVSIGSNNHINLNPLNNIYLNGPTYAEQLYVTTPGTAQSNTANCRIATGENNRIMFTSTSSRKIKHDIKPIEKESIDPHKLYDADVIQFVYNLDYLSDKDDRYDTPVPGFVAEDLQKVYPIAVDMENGEAKDWNPRYIIPPMLALIQEQNERIKALERGLA